MPPCTPHTLIRTGSRVSLDAIVLDELYTLAHALCPEGFPHDETRVLTPLLAHISLELVDTLATDLSTALALPRELFRRDRFSVQGAGPVSLHDDKRNYPGMYFVIVVVHSGRLGVVDRRAVAQRHTPGEILLLDPQKKHAVVPIGTRGGQQRMAPSTMFATDPAQQFMFLDFEVARTPLRHLFRDALPAPAPD